MDPIERARLRAENAIAIVRWAARCMRDLGHDEEAEALDAYVERVDRDEPLFDATDGAHPAWWRGHDYTARRFGDLVSRLRAAEKERERLRATLSRVLGKLEAVLEEDHELARGTPMPAPAPQLVEVRR
jgi:hypothetical protein